MKQDTVSLCMIVRDEEASLPRCLDSIKEYVDEIIIVDTGSCDRTRDIARAYGAQVIAEPWRDNFSQARNAGLECARGDWILFLDADEEVLPENLSCLRNLAQTSMDGFFLQVLNFDDEGNCVRQPALRLFRNHPRHRFRGAIHEQVIDAILEQKPEARFGLLDIKIKHSGYQNRLVGTKDKIKRNLAILQAEYARGGPDPFLLFNLGTEYLRAGELARALHYYHEAERLAGPSLSFTHLLGKKKIQTLMLLHDYQAALAAIDRYLELYPDYTDLVFLKATLFYCLARFAAALQLYQTCLAMGEAPARYVSERGVGTSRAARGVKEAAAILARCRQNSALQPGLSLCMIARDAARYLGQCLASARGGVDEIIVVDTGSRDGTGEVARACGAEVFSFPWMDDFALARNFALALARREWVLVLDADETLRAGEQEKLRQAIGTSNDLQGYYLKVVNYFGQGDPDDFVVDAVCRLFRNRPEFRFSGVVHEDISQSIIEHCGPGSIAPLEIHIDHRGYLQRAVLKEKSARNTGLLNSRLEQEPSDGYALYALSAELFQEGDFPAALEHLQRAVGLLAGRGARADLYFKMAACHLELQQFREGLQVVREGQQLFPDFTSLWYMEGMLHFQQGHLLEAHRAWQAALAMGDPPWHLYTYPHGIGSFRTAAALAGCLEKMGRPDEAEALLARYLARKEGLASLILPFCRLLLSRYDGVTCLEKIGQLSLPASFRAAFLLADAFIRLERPDLAQVFLRRCRDFLEKEPAEGEFLQLAGLQLGLAGKYCARGLEIVGPSPALEKTRDRIMALLNF